MESCKLEVRKLKDGKLKALIVTFNLTGSGWLLDSALIKWESLKVVS